MDYDTLRAVTRFTIDALCAFVVFLSGAAAIRGELFDLLSSPLSFAAPEQFPALLLLAGTFASLAAVNLYIFRHLRRAYSSPRRDGWRGE